MFKKVCVLAAIFMMVGVCSAYAIQMKAEVTGVDTETPAITLVDASGSMITVVITPETDVQVGFKDILLTDINAGSTVVVRYDVKAGKNVARYVGLLDRKKVATIKKVCSEK